MVTKNVKGRAPAQSKTRTTKGGSQAAGRRRSAGNSKGGLHSAIRSNNIDRATDKITHVKKKDGGWAKIPPVMPKKKTPAKKTLVKNKRK